MNTQEISNVFELHKKHKFILSKSPVSYRIQKLEGCRQAILDHTDEIADALEQDFGKARSESYLSEILPIISMINYTISNLSSWMKPQKVKTTLTFKGTSSFIQPHAKGCVLILSPWNYPFQLSFYPLLTAFSAGNTVVLKPSEYTPENNKVMKKIIEKVFSREEVHIFEGGSETATELMKLPFNHFFFTGSTPVGRIVMEAASKHLASVSLELGGKTPVLIDKNYDMKKSIHKLVWGKCLNSSQTCISPDYVLIDESKLKEFLEIYKKQVEVFYAGVDFSKNPDYAKIITPKHTQRLIDMIQDAKNSGANVIELGEHSLEMQTIAPTLIVNATKEMKVMKEEIFGPLLPIITYTDLSEAINFINDYPNPLSLYIFSSSEYFIEKAYNSTFSGGVSINDCVIAAAHPALPFGGSGASGIGNYHGRYGFEEFSNLKSIIKRNYDLGTSYFFPPYSKKVECKIKYLLEKWSRLF